MSGDFKMILPSSPGLSFKTKLMISRKQEGFILADVYGKFKIYAPSLQKSCPYVLHEEMPSGIDKDDSWSKNYLKTESGSPYFALTGADVFGDYMFYTTVSK